MQEEKQLQRVGSGVQSLRGVVHHGDTLQTDYSNREGFGGFKFSGVFLEAFRQLEALEILVGADMVTTIGHLVMEGCYWKGGCRAVVALFLMEAE